MFPVAIPYKSHNKTLTLSMVLPLTSWTRVTERFQFYLDVFNHYLKEYPPLPFEILVVFCQEKNDNLTFHDVIKVPPLMTSIVRHFHVPYFLMEILKSKFNISYLPEFIF
jgi:hypothetical protein